MTQGIVIDFNANLARFTTNVDKAINDLNRFNKSSSLVGREINKVFSTLGVGLSAAGFVAIIKGSIDAADKLGDLNKSTGIAVEQLAGLKLASEQSGAELEGVAAAINKLSENIGKDTEKFAKLGITARDPLEAFKQLADVFVAIEDPQQRAAVAAAALGKSWATAAPLLAEGGRAIGEMVDKGARLSGVTHKMVADADKFNDSMAEMKTATDKLVMQLSAGLLPIMQSLSDDFLDTRINTDDLNDSFSPFIETVRALTILAGNFSFTFKAIGNDIGGMAAQVNALAHGDFSGFSKMHELMIQDGEAARKAFDEWEQRILNSGKTTSAAMIDDFKALKAFIKSEQGSAVNVSGFIGDPAGEARTKAEEKRYQDLQKFVEERRKGEQQAMADDYKQIQRWNDLADPAAKYRQEIEDIKFSMSEVGGVSQQVAEANIKLLQQQIDETDRTTREMNHLWEQFTGNVQRDLGDVLYDGMNGKFNDIGEMFKQLLLRMAADAAAFQITQTLLGGFTSLGGLLGGGRVPAGGGYSPSGGSFDGGGYTGPGSRIGGIDGKGGFAAILHPNETVLDHTKGQGMGGITVSQTNHINIDSRTDRAEVAALVDRAIQNGNAQLVDRLQRAGAI